MNAIIDLLTTTQVATAKAGKVVFADNAEQGKQWIAAGVKVNKTNSRTYSLDFFANRELTAHLNQHGVAVKVVRIDGKYSDNNGAYEVMTVADIDGNEWSVGNCYDQSACFRNMDDAQRLEYANNN